MRRSARVHAGRLALLLCVALLATGCAFADLEGFQPGQLPAPPGGGAADAAGDGDCTDVLLLAARGTGEPGTLGFVVGDPLFRALRREVGSASASPVDYPAVAVTLSGVQQGADDVVAQLGAQADVCPDQRFALSGYSQGAMVIVSALEDIPADVAERVAAVVLFGNPYRARGTGDFEDRTLDICATGDTVCGGGGGGSGVGHISYGGDVGRAAAFIAEQLGA